jgi:hypothetical protein
MCILLLVVTLFTLTDFTVNNKSRSLIGNFVTYIVYANILGNFIGIFLRVVERVKYWYARIKFEIGMKRIRKEREEHAFLMAIMNGRIKAKVQVEGELEEIKEVSERSDGSSNLSAIRDNVLD